MYRLILVLVSLLLWRVANAQHLFKIHRGDLYGFIDSTGKQIIEAHFLSVGDFSEGVAPARVDGQYGYIDTTGSFVIAPQYDYAESFSEGLAVAYIGSRPHCIDRFGKVAFDHPFTELSAFQKGRALVTTASGRKGVINKTGRLALDTVYKEIAPFQNGVTVVTGWRHNPYPQQGEVKYNELGVVDTSGKVIVSYGRYLEIEPYENGYAAFRTIPADGDSTGESILTGFLDTRGNPAVTVRGYKRYYIHGTMRHGLAPLYIYKYWLPDTEDHYAYSGYINTRGEIVCADTAVEYTYDFYDRRAIIEDSNGHVYIIDPDCRRINSVPLEHGILGQRFFNGLAFFHTDSGWGAIDTNANVVFPPKFRQLDQWDITGEHIYFQWFREGKPGIVYGIADRKGNVIAEPFMDDFDRRGFTHGLLLCRIDGRWSYIDGSANVVWRAEADTALRNLNIDYKNRGYYYAVSTNKSVNRDHSQQGYAVRPAKVSKTPSKSSGVGPDLIVEETPVRFEKVYRGVELSVENRSARTIKFNAEDNRLPLYLQAKDSTGAWRDIEYLPGSWCGNSYHTIDLAPGQGWTFAAPVYDGEIKTKLRAVLRYIDPADKNKSEWERREVTVYSNEFDGAVNPAQFWRYPGYTPSNIMDPYYN